jgi:hypothetical protein
MGVLTNRWYSGSVGNVLLFRLLDGGASGGARAQVLGHRAPFKFRVAIQASAQHGLLRLHCSPPAGKYTCYPATVARAGSDHAPRARRGVSHAPRYQMSLPTHALGNSQRNGEAVALAR